MFQLYGPTGRPFQRLTDKTITTEVVAPTLFSGDEADNLRVLCDRVNQWYRPYMRVTYTVNAQDSQYVYLCGCRYSSRRRDGTLRYGRYTRAEYETYLLEHATRELQKHGYRATCEVAFDTRIKRSIRYIRCTLAPVV